MKQISTIDMSARKKQVLIGNVLGAFGNDNIRWHHIKYFEDRVVKYGEDKMSEVGHAHYYFAWLCLMVEHLFWMMRNFCMLHREFDEDALGYGYNKVVAVFCDICKDLNKYDEDHLKCLYNKAVAII
jgi:hypothetical protein